MRVTTFNTLYFKNEKKIKVCIGCVTVKRQIGLCRFIFGCFPAAAANCCASHPAELLARVHTATIEHALLLASVDSVVGNFEEKTGAGC